MAQVDHMIIALTCQFASDYKSPLVDGQGTERAAHVVQLKFIEISQTEFNWMKRGKKMASECGRLLSSASTPKLDKIPK